MAFVLFASGPLSLLVGDSRRMARVEVQGTGRLPVCASKRILGEKQPSQCGKLDRKVRLHRPPKEPLPQANTTSTLSPDAKPTPISPEGPAEPPGPISPQIPRSNSPLICPECGSSNLNKAGFRYLFDATAVQRWRCKDCEHRFSEKMPEESSRPLQEILGGI